MENTISLNKEQLIALKEEFLGTNISYDEYKN